MSPIVLSGGGIHRYFAQAENRPLRGLATNENCAHRSHRRD